MQIATDRSGRGVLRSLLLSLVIVSPSAAFGDVTGSWSGSGTFTGVCRYTDTQNQNVTVPFSGTVNLNLFLLQSSSLVTGAVEIDNVPNTTTMCQVNGTLPPVSGPLSGTISGSTLTGVAILPGDHGPQSYPFSATASGSSMVFSVGQAGQFLITGTLNQTSTQPPDSTHTGTYDGTFTGSFVPCGNPPPVMYSGSVTAGLIQAGISLTGSITISDSKRDVCDTPASRTVIDTGPATAMLSAQISGGSITGITVSLPKGDLAVLNATISGETITGSAGDVHRVGDGVTFTITRSSGGTPAPAVASFFASPATINAGDSATLTWSTINADSVSLDNGIGNQRASGSVIVSPNQTTTYNLTATGPGGSAAATTIVTVVGSGPRVVIGTFPGGMLQATGASGATDSFSVSNVGTAVAAVTLSQSDNFFSVSPASFTIAPETSQVVVITANARPADTYDGTITVSPNGITVPVHLLVAAAPTAPVIAQAAVSRSVVFAPANQNPTGSLSFKNNGSGTLQGIAVSDVPWVLPQGGVINIAPGQTQQVSFSTDRSRRPDSGFPIGGASGKISLDYFANLSAKGVIPLSTTPTGSVSVTIVDVVKPTLSSDSPPPLQNGELALFIAGLGSNSSGLSGDLLFSSRAALADLKLFMKSAQGNAAASLPQIVPNIGFTLPAVARSVFSLETGTPSFQFRSTSASSVSLSAIRVLNSGAVNFFTALPVFRSDRGISPGERLLLTGVEASAGKSTVLLLQEVSGNPATLQMQPYDSSGAAVGSSVPVTLAPFGGFNDSGATVTGAAQSVAITNSSSGYSRVNAYARVQDNGTGDAWVVVDPTKLLPPSDALIIPLIKLPAAQLDVFVVNGATSPTDVRVETIATPARRRAVSHGVSSPSSNAAQTLTVLPLQTRRISPTAGVGFLRLTAPAGSISAAARVTLTRPDGETYGAALPAMSVAAALASTESKRFTGVDDAAQGTVAAATAGTLRSALILLETAGQTATVRVTLRYSFVAGSLVGSRAVSSKDFNLAASQTLVINDLARSIIGPQRDSFGDLRNMQLDVDVIDGSGKVLAFVESIDNGSGDLMIRAE